ncbi:MAG TPA: SDR family oxidoreductase [Candidatus Latescibacteria bacterium]|nr:SDR family oxidoreductase [Candidatus Latescibacterota bacterium]
MDIWKLFSLDGKVALVTGGAGLVGSSVSEALAEAGAVVIIASRDIKKCQAKAGELRKQGLRVRAEQLDITDERSVSDFKGRIVSEWGRIDILANNAVSRPMKRFDSPIEDWESSMKVNSTGLFLCTRIFISQMMKQNQGNIINISSIYGMVGPDFRIYDGTDMDMPPDYAFHKGGLINFTRYLATRFAPHIRVNCISLGGLFADQPTKFVESYNRRVPLGRMAKGDDLKGAVVFLASDASAYVTGHNLVVDGGWTAW